MMAAASAAGLVILAASVLLVGVVASLELRQRWRRWRARRRQHAATVAWSRRVLAELREMDRLAAGGGDLVDMLIADLAVADALVEVDALNAAILTYPPHTHDYGVGTCGVCGVAGVAGHALLEREAA